MKIRPFIIGYQRGQRIVARERMAQRPHPDRNARAFIVTMEITFEPCPKLARGKAWRWLSGDRGRTRSYRLHRVGITTIGDARMHGRAFVVRLCGYLPEVRRETIALGVVADA